MAVLLTVEQVANLLNTTPQTVRKYIRDGKLRASYIGNKHQIKQEWVEDLIEQQQVRR